MAFLAERMAAMVLETAMPDLTADGIADALILDGKVVAPATDAAVSSTQCCRRRRCGKEQNKQTSQAKPRCVLAGIAAKRTRSADRRRLAFCFYFGRSPFWLDSLGDLGVAAALMVSTAVCIV